MNGPFIFGCGPGHLPRRAHDIAKRHGAALVNYTEPRGEKRHWFTARNAGHPFDGHTRDAVLADLRAARIIDGAP